MDKTESMVFKPTHPHEIDANKIKTLDDVIKVVGLLKIRLDDTAVKGLEHLIVEGDE